MDIALVALSKQARQRGSQECALACTSSLFEQPCQRKRLQASLARTLKHSQALRLAFAGRSSPASQVLLQLGVLGNSVSGDRVPPLSQRA